MLDQSLLDSIPLPIRILEQRADGTPIYRWVNHAAATNTGYPPNKIIGRSANELFPNLWGNVATQKHREVFLSNSPSNYVHKMPLNGDLRTLRTTLVPTMLEMENAPCIVASSIDITDQEYNEAQWLKAETINQQIKEFAALTAHDLRTPLRQISAFTDMLREDFIDSGDGKLALINTIKDIAERSSELVSQLLKYSSDIEDTGSKIESFDLNLLCADIFLLLDPLRLHNLTRASSRILADKTVIRIVLRNLIDNAIKHNHPKLMNVHVSVTSSTNAPGFLTFTVTDNGKGMDSTACTIETKKNAEGNSGHGLPAIERLLRAHDGHISIHSLGKDEGTKITFTFPGTLC